MINVKDIRKEIFSTNFISLFPKTCLDCGSDMKVTDSLTELFCTNPYCKGKVIDRFKNLVYYLDINITEEDIIGFIEKYSINSPYYLFLYNPKKDGAFSENTNMEDSFRIFKEVNRKRFMLLWEYLYIGFLPFIKESAEVVFSNYSDIEEFYMELEEKGMELIQKILVKHDGVEDNSILTQTVLIYDTLNTYKSELLKGIKGIVVVENLEEIPIFFAVDSNIKSHKSKKELLMDLNNIYKDRYYFYETFDINKANYVFWEDFKNNKKTELMKYIEAYFREKEVVTFTKLLEKIGD